MSHTEHYAVWQTADLTAISIYQATLAVPGRVIPNDPEVERAIRKGESILSTKELRATLQQ